MPVIRLADVPEMAQIGPGKDTIVMKKVIGSRERDPGFEMPDETPSLSLSQSDLGQARAFRQPRKPIAAMYIVNGNGVAQVGDEPPQGFGAGDFILVPKGVQYECDGNFTYLVINSPAYRRGSDLKHPDP